MKKINLGETNGVFFKAALHLRLEDRSHLNVSSELLHKLHEELSDLLNNELRANLHWQLNINCKIK